MHFTRGRDFGIVIGGFGRGGLTTRRAMRPRLGKNEVTRSDFGAIDIGEFGRRGLTTRVEPKCALRVER